MLVLNTVKKLVHSVPGAGAALLPFYHTILPIINGFKNRTSTSNTHAHAHR